MQSRITYLYNWICGKQLERSTLSALIAKSKQLYGRERGSTHSPFAKKRPPPLKTAKPNDTRHLIILCCVLYTYKHSLAKKLFSDRFTQTTKTCTRSSLEQCRDITKSRNESDIPDSFDRFTASEILSFLLNVHGIRLSLRQLRRILKNQGCTRREQSTDMFHCMGCRRIQRK